MPSEGWKREKLAKKWSVSFRQTKPAQAVRAKIKDIHDLEVPRPGLHWVRREYNKAAKI